MLRRVAMVLLPLLFVLPLVAAQCLPRQCLDHRNCERFCECEDAQTNNSIPCTMFFRCDENSGVCADEYNMSCDQVCQNYAAVGTCGSKTCEDESDCLRQAICAPVNEESGEVRCTYNCDVPFACASNGEAGGTCAPEFLQDDQTVCAQFCPAPPGCGV